jgi:phospholipase C
MKKKPIRANTSRQKRSLFSLSFLSFSFLAVFAISCKKHDLPGCEGKKDLKQIGHVVVIYLENHSFDNLYGQFPGANGFSTATYAKQVDSFGNVYDTLPAIPADTLHYFPTDLANEPFSIEKYLGANTVYISPTHRWYQEQAQIDGGKMDKFAAVSSARALTMGYYNTNRLPLAAEAKNYTLCDNLFHSAFGGSFLNHIWLIAAATPVFPNAPAAIVAQFDSSGNLIKDGTVTPDGYVVNTAYSVNRPHPATIPIANLVPYQTMPTIGDRLSDKGIDWAWYSGGWDDELSGKPDSSLEFQYHHQPFIYFQNYAEGTTAKEAHLKDETEFIAAAKNGTLPPVSFVKPVGINNEHPGYADLLTGENHTVELINAVRNGPNWKDAVIIITYDENGGFWDHVSPPVIDKWGPGTRVPAIIISPFAKRGYVDHTQYETVSILKLIEKRWDLPALTNRDNNALYFENALKFRH